MGVTLTKRGRLVLSWLTERTAPDRAALQVDEEKGIIAGVKVLGRYSPNCHGVRGVTEGTEYTPACMKAALSLYESETVYCDHPDERNRDNSRSVNDTFGVIKNIRMGEDGNSIRGDLHYMKNHPLAARVVEDVKRGLGVFGLSHNALPGKAKVAGGRYVIEQIESVRSVDLVDRPATNKNLWESRAVSKTFREVLEARLPKLSKARQSLANRLLEMDGDAMPAMDTPMPTDAPTDPTEALTAGFKAAMLAVLDDDSLDAAGKLAKLKTLLTMHEKITAEDEPATEDDETDADPKVEEDEETDEEKDKEKTATESLRTEVKRLKAKDECRSLCEAMNVTPSTTLLKALTLLESKGDRLTLIKEHKGDSKDATNKPRSSGPPSGRKNVTEAEEPKDAKGFAALVRG